MPRYCLRSRLVTSMAQRSKYRLATSAGEIEVSEEMKKSSQ
jgi:hypothetical protein